MEITISTNDIDGIRYICAVHDLSYFTLPNKPGLTDVVLRHSNGKELSPELAFAVGREMESKLSLDRTEREISKLPMPNNVVVIVEPIEDLP